MNRRDFQSLAETRLSDAQALLASGRFDGAYYLAGYAVECALKACIAKNTQRHDFPDRTTVNGSYTHNLNGLLNIAQLDSSLRTDLDAILRVNWATAANWKEDSRYARTTQKEAEDLFSAIADRRHGVMSWLRRRW